jgi:hypothetical protein
MNKKKQDSNPEKNDVTIDVINSILNLHSKEYDHMKEIAHKDIAKDFMDRIETFLEKRNDLASVENLKKIIFEDASKVEDEDINDIMDAFTKVRSEDTLDNIDDKSIEEILLLFNQFVATDKNHQGIPKEIFSDHKQAKTKESIKNLEEEIFSFQEKIKSQEIGFQYKIDSLNLNPQQNIYSSEANDVYHIHQSDDFFGSILNRVEMQDNYESKKHAYRN